MKPNGFVRWWKFLTCLLALAAGVAPASAAVYKLGDVVTNFTLINRMAWTNESGRAFGPGTPLRLSDFGGKVLFMEFFRRHVKHLRVRRRSDGAWNSGLLRLSRRQ